MFEKRSRLVSILVTASICLTLVLTGSSRAASAWSTRIAAANPSGFTDSSGNAWLADRYFSGGSGWGNPSQAVAGTFNDRLYQNHRWGLTGYAVPVPEKAVYRVTLHFAELVFAQEGKRVFDVSAEKILRVNDLDVVDRAGFATAYVERFDVEVTDGTLNLDFGRVVEDPMVSGIQIERVANATSDWGGGSFARRVNTGTSSSYTDVAGQSWSADNGYVRGGSFGPVNTPIGGTDDDRIYQSHRWGMKSYNVRVPASGVYTVRLHFSETVFRERGKRVFDVSAENTLLLNDLDVFAQAGYANALPQTFQVPVYDGYLSLKFGSVVEDPMLSGLEVIASGTGNVQSASPTTTAAPTTTTQAPTTTTQAPTTTTQAPTTTTTAPPPSAPTTSTGFPNASNTGVPAGTALRPSGTIWTSFDGQVIDAMDVNGSIRVNHNNVVIRRTRVKNPGGEAIWQDPTKGGLLIEDCELDGTGNTDGRSAVAFANYTIRRCNIHHFGEGPTANGNTLIEGNYMHSFTNFISQGAHQDGIQLEYGSNQTIRNNTIIIGVDGANAAIWVGPTNPHSGILIENNLVAGGSFAIGAGGGGETVGRTSAGNTDITVRNNRVSTQIWPKGGWYGPLVYTSGLRVSGNVWHETGQPI